MLSKVFNCETSQQFLVKLKFSMKSYHGFEQKYPEIYKKEGPIIRDPRIGGIFILFQASFP